MVKKKIVFTHIPKTGGLSIQEALGLTRIRNIKNLNKDFVIPDRVTFGHLPIPFLERRGIVDSRKVFKFTFVRNPYDRIVSMYEYYKTTEQGKDYKGSFLHFCRNIKDFNYKTRMPMYAWTKGVEFDFIGKFENLQEDFDKLCDLLRVERKTLPHINKGDHKPYKEYYNRESEVIVRRRYEKDFKQFEYEYDNLYN